MASEETSRVEHDWFAEDCYHTFGPRVGYCDRTHYHCRRCGKDYTCAEIIPPNDRYCDPEILTRRGYREDGPDGSVDYKKHWWQRRTASMSNEQLKHMVDRFLQWKLPENFNPDGGISFKKTFNENAPWGPMKSEPVGTNLFDAVQAEAMVRYMVNGLPAERGEPAAEPRPVKVNHDAAPVRCAEEDPESQQCRDGMAPDGTGGTEPAAPAPAAPLDYKAEFERMGKVELVQELASLSAELEQVRKALKQFEHIEDEPVSATAEVAAESYSFLENDRDSLRRELEQVKAERDQLNTNADTLERRMVEAETLIRGLMLRAKGWPEYTEAEQWLEAALGEKGQQ